MDGSIDQSIDSCVVMSAFKAFVLHVAKRSFKSLVVVAGPLNV